MSRVVMVITSEHIEFITSAEGTSDKINVSRVITITTSDIFQYLKANRSALTLHCEQKWFQKRTFWVCFAKSFSSSIIDVGHKKMIL